MRYFNNCGFCDYVLFAPVKLTTDIIYGRYIPYQSDKIKMNSPLKYAYVGRRLIL